MLDLAACTDGELAALAQGGRQAAYAELMKRHRHAAFRLARSHSGNEDAALDIVQESFVSAFAALDRYDGGRPFRHWLARIVLNKCRDHARRNAVRGFFTRARPLDDALQIGEDEPSPEDSVAQAQDLRRTLQAIAQLPTRLREVLVLCAIEDLPQADVAQILGITKKAVETRLYRARAKLSEALDRSPGG